MTQKICETLNLPSLEDALREKGLLPDAPEDADDEPMDPALQDTLAIAEAAQERYMMISGHDHSKAMDDIHEETLKHAQDLMDLGYNTEITRQRGIFEIATMMYARAIEAKNSKRDAQLEAMKLALNQRKLDLLEKRLRHEIGEETVINNASVIIGDRNDILKRLKEHKENNPD